MRQARRSGLTFLLVLFALSGARVATAAAVTAPDCTGKTGRECVKAFVAAGWAESNLEVDGYSQHAIEAGIRGFAKDCPQPGMDKVSSHKEGTCQAAQKPDAGASIAEAGFWEISMMVSEPYAVICAEGNGLTFEFPPDTFHGCELPEGKATEALVEDGAEAEPPYVPPPPPPHAATDADLHEAVDEGVLYVLGGMAGLMGVALLWQTVRP